MVSMYQKQKFILIYFKCLYNLFILGQVLRKRCKCERLHSLNSVCMIYYSHVAGETGAAGKHWGGWIHHAGDQGEDRGGQRGDWFKIKRGLKRLGWQDNDKEYFDRRNRALCVSKPSKLNLILCAHHFGKEWNLKLFLSVHFLCRTQRS